MLITFLRNIPFQVVTYMKYKTLVPFKKKYICINITYKFIKVQPSFFIKKNITNYNFDLLDFFEKR
jgi:hypothetical protein